MGFHSNVTTGAIHIVYNYSYANDAARETATGFVAADIGKVAIQTNDNTLWLLVATTPTWVPISGAMLGQLDGYVSDFTFQEFKTQYSQVVQTLTQADDGYQTQLSLLQSQQADQTQWNQSVRTSLDGYIIGSGSGPQADGYIAFYVNSTTIAGDNDLFYDRAKSRLGIGTTSPLGELHILGDHPNLLVQAGTNANATIRLTEDASYKGGFIRYEGGSSPETVAIGRHASSDTTDGNDAGVINIRIDSSAVSIAGTYGLGSATVTISATDANLAFLETDPSGIVSTASLGKIYVGTDQRFYYIGSNGVIKLIVFNTDLDGYGQNWVDASQQLQDLRDAADGYGITQQENKSAQQQINQSVLQALDGYAILTTENQRWIDSSQQIQDLRDASDGYALKSVEDQRWIDTSQQIQDIRDVLDADAYVDSLTFTENKEAQGEINDVILTALDGYALAAVSGVSETTFQENKNAQEQINQSIIQSLDGYGGAGGVSETTFTENKNAQQQINQSIIQALDGYAAEGSDGYATTVSTQIFTNSGTWTPPATCKSVTVICVGGGGGGGSGRRGATGSARLGGGGGGGGAVTVMHFDAQTLGGAAVTVTVGTGGAGGAGVTADSTNGNDGGNGIGSSFGTWLFAGGGGFGTKGDTANSKGGGSGGVIGTASGITGGTPAAGTTNAISGQSCSGGLTAVAGRNAEWGGGSGAGGNWQGVTVAGGSSIYAAGGGGAGGGIYTDNVDTAGGAGGTVQSYAEGGGGAGGAAGVSGTAGANNITLAKGYGGEGGGGGGSAAGVPGAGGAGGIPGGGGGGSGAGVNGNAGQAGGEGGRGEVRVIAYF